MAYGGPIQRQPSYIQLFTCTVCMDVFRDPRILPNCHHTFCRSCLEGLFNNARSKPYFICPNCRKRVDIPEGGVSEFPKNFWIQSRNLEEARKASDTDDAPTQQQTTSDHLEENETAALVDDTMDDWSIAFHLTIDELESSGLVMATLDSQHKGGMDGLEEEELQKALQESLSMQYQKQLQAVLAAEAYSYWRKHRQAVGEHREQQHPTPQAHPGTGHLHPVPEEGRPLDGNLRRRQGLLREDGSHEGEQQRRREQQRERIHEQVRTFSEIFRRHFQQENERRQSGRESQGEDSESNISLFNEDQVGDNQGRVIQTGQEQESELGQMFRQLRNIRGKDWLKDD